MKQIIATIAALAVAFVAGLVCGHRCHQADLPTRVDTLRLVALRADTVRVTDTIWRRLPAVAGSDTVLVALEREQAVYSDSIYRAWVSGYEPRLDSIELHYPSLAIPQVTQQRSSRWSIGLSAGVAVTPRGTSPYIGLGLTFSLWP